MQQLKAVQARSQRWYWAVPYAAVVLSEVVQALEIQRVVISAFGLLVWRQAGSPAARAVRTARRLLERS